MSKTIIHIEFTFQCSYGNKERAEFYNKNSNMNNDENYFTVIFKSTNSIKYFSFNYTEKNIKNVF